MVLNKGFVCWFTGLPASGKKKKFIHRKKRRKLKED